MPRRSMCPRALSHRCWYAGRKSRASLLCCTLFRTAKIEVKVFWTKKEVLPVEGIEQNLDNRSRLELDGLSVFGRLDALADKI